MDTEQQSLPTEHIYETSDTEVLNVFEADEATLPVDESVDETPQTENLNTDGEAEYEFSYDVFNNASAELRQRFEDEFRVPYDKFIEEVNKYKSSIDQQQAGDNSSAYGAMSRFWSVDSAEAKSRVELVKEYCKGKPKEFLDRHDNPEGIDYLYLKAKASLGKQVPQYNKTSSPSRAMPVNNSKAPVFTKTQLYRMSEVEYQKRLPEIERAFRLGLVADK
jgi:hypothetical protein